ncbi:MAG: mannose-1-phosphate guanylyltransferase/mannose-6-phosphate isomerase, partial [Methyloligellaceae bacterium]
MPKIVKRIARGNSSGYERPAREYRPWGFFETLNSGTGFQVKLLHVKPGAKLSHQMHRHRSEHWVVVKGTARITRGE